MIQVSVLYPYTEGARFDWDYYAQKHMPMAQEKLGPALKSWTVLKGLSGGRPGSAPSYFAIGHMLFDSVSDFSSAFGPHAKAIGADLVNYTEVKPVIEISEVLAHSAAAKLLP